MFRRVRQGNKHAMKDFGAKLTAQLQELTGMVRRAAAKCALTSPPPARRQAALAHGTLSHAHTRAQAATSTAERAPLPAPAPQVRGELGGDVRRKVNTLVITDVHARDIVDTFVRDSVMDAREFAWESQLRFYWDRDRVGGACGLG